MHRPPVERPGDFTVLPRKMYLAAKRARCQIPACHAVYQSLKSYASHPGRLTLVKQHIHHLIPRRYLHQYAIYEHYQGNLLSVCATCHGRVDEMQAIYQKGTLLMEWCLDCHRQPELYVRPHDQGRRITSDQPRIESQRRIRLETPICHPSQLE